MTRATTTLAAILFTVLYGGIAHAQSDANSARLAPTESVNLDVPNGWMASAMTARDGYLWVGAQSTTKPSALLRFATDGTLRASVKTASTGNVGGIDFDDEGVCNLDYSTNTSAGKRRLERFASDGTRRKAAVQASGGHNTFGLAWHGKGFYQGSSPVVRAQSVIHRLDANGRRLDSREVPFYTRGMAWHRGQLWVTTGPHSGLFVLSADLEIVRSYKLSVAVSDIAFIDGQLYGLGQNSNRLHRFAIPSTRPAGSVLAASEPTHRPRATLGWSL